MRVAPDEERSNAGQWQAAAVAGGVATDEDRALGAVTTLHTGRRLMSGRDKPGRAFWRVPSGDRFECVRPVPGLSRTRRP
jgi:hypothetical protein